MKSVHLNKGIKIMVLLMSVLALFTLSSCKKGSSNNPVVNDNYYVKYTIKGYSPSGRISNWTVTAPQGNYTYSGPSVLTWNETYGPVTKGFKCEVQIVNYVGGLPTIEIHVSKNSEPFALKVTNTGTSAIYTIY